LISFRGLTALGNLEEVMSAVILQLNPWALDKIRSGFEFSNLNVIEGLLGQVKGVPRLYVALVIFKGRICGADLLELE
jgi:hypothetical protein